jgi:hypothetical protein
LVGTKGTTQALTHNLIITTLRKYTVKGKPQSIASSNVCKEATEATPHPHRINPEHRTISISKCGNLEAYLRGT